MVQAALQRGTILAACVSEAVRLQAPGMDIRIAATDLQLPGSYGKLHRICKVLIHVYPPTLRPGCSCTWVTHVYIVYSIYHDREQARHEDICAVGWCWRVIRVG